MGVIKFSTQVGSHRLDVLTNDALQGTYYRDESGKVSIVSVFAVNPGQGHFSAFLDALPRNETVEFDNVVSRKVRGAVSRRGFVDRSGMDDWIRLASPESGE